MNGAPPSVASVHRYGRFCLGLSLALSATSRRPSLRPGTTSARKRSELNDLSATFEDLNIQNSGDVVKHLVHTTSLAAELLRGPGGRSTSSTRLSSKVCQVLSEAQNVCKEFLPQILRGHASVLRLLDLFVEALGAAGQSKDAFKQLETPLVVFHSKAPLAMRKGLQSRIVGVADTWPMILQILSPACFFKALYITTLHCLRSLMYIHLAKSKSDCFLSEKCHYLPEMPLNLLDGVYLRTNCLLAKHRLKPIHLAFPSLNWQQQCAGQARK